MYKRKLELIMSKNTSTKHKRKLWGFIRRLFRRIRRTFRRIVRRVFRPKPKPKPASYYARKYPMPR